MTFRFVHAADLHLDTPFTGIGAVAPRVAEALRDASLDAFDALVEATLTREADALLIAGDVYDGAERGVRAQLRFLRGLQRLCERGVRVFVVHGNHDPLDGWSAIRAWPTGVHVFGPEAESVAVHKDGRVVATVHGVSYGTRDVRENLARRLAPSPEGGLQIGLLHATVGSHPEHAPYSPCSAEELRAAGMDYWALGHIHQREVVHREPWIVYPGNLQGRSSKPSEQGAKGALVVEAHGRTLRGDPEFVALDRARFVGVEVDVAGLPDVPALRGRLADEAAALREAHRNRGLIVRATLSGRGAVHGDLHRPGALAQLLGDLRDGEAAAEPFLWWESLRARTAASFDRESLRRRGDFAGALVDFSDDLAADDGRLSGFLERRLTSIRGGRWVRVLETAVLRGDHDLLRAAEALALDRLLAEEEAS